MRSITSAIALLLSAVVVLARVPLHRRAIVPRPSEPADPTELSSSGTKVSYLTTPLPTLLAYSGVSFFALYLLVALRRRCRIRIAGRRLTFGRATTHMGALELEGSEVELLPTVAEPGVREARPPLPAVLDDTRSELSDDITEGLIKPMDAQTIPLIPISTTTPLPPSSPFSPPSSPPPLPYGHPSHMHPSYPHSIDVRVPVSPYASPPAQSATLPQVPLSPPLLPSMPIRQSRLGSPRPSFSKSKSTPSFDINARFATYPQRSKSSPPLPRPRTKLGHGRSDSQLSSSSNSGASESSLQPLPPTVTLSIPVPLVKPPTQIPNPFALSPPHIALSRSKSTGSDLIDLSTPALTPSASTASLVKLALVETPLGKDIDANILRDIPSLVKDNDIPTQSTVSVQLPEGANGHGHASEVDLVDLRFRSSPAAPGAIALSLSNSSSSPSTSGSAPRPAAPNDLPETPALPSSTHSSPSSSMSSSSSSSPSSATMELFVPPSLHSTPGTTPMRNQFVITDRDVEAADKGQTSVDASGQDTESEHSHSEASPHREQVYKWDHELPSLESGMMTLSADWHDHSNVWGLASPAAPPLPIFPAMATDVEAEKEHVQLIHFEDDVRAEGVRADTVDDAWGLEDAAAKDVVDAVEVGIEGGDLIQFEDEDEVREGKGKEVEVLAAKAEAEEDARVDVAESFDVAEEASPLTRSESQLPVELPAVRLEHEVHPEVVVVLAHAPESEVQTVTSEDDVGPYDVHDDSNEIHDTYDDEYMRNKYQNNEIDQPSGGDLATPESPTAEETVARIEAVIAAEEGQDDGEVASVADPTCYPDPDLLPLPVVDTPPPQSPAKTFYIELVRSPSLPKQESAQPSVQAEQTDLLPALIISAPTPNRTTALDGGPQIVGVVKACFDDPKTPSPTPSPIESRMPTPLQTPTPPSSPPPTTPSRRSPRIGLPVMNMAEKVERTAMKQLQPEQWDNVGEDTKDKEGKRPAWSLRAADAPSLGLPSANSGKDKKVTTSRTDEDSVEEDPVKVEQVQVKEPPLILAEVKVDGPVASTEATQNIIKEAEVTEISTNNDNSLRLTSPVPLGLSRSLPGSFDDTPTVRLRSTVKSTADDVSASSDNVDSSITSSPRTGHVARPRDKPRTRSAIDIALAMQLRPGIGIGADPAWLVRFLMAMFGWFAVLISGNGELEGLLVGRR